MRGVDDYSRAKVNGATSVEEKWRHDTVDQLFALASAFHEEVRRAQSSPQRRVNPVRARADFD